MCYYVEPFEVPEWPGAVGRVDGPWHVGGSGDHRILATALEGGVLESSF
jgi:hypothetical protein